jgi:hypothetical protein
LSAPKDLERAQEELHAGPPRRLVDLIEFLKSLTDDMAIHDPRFADPWPRKN